MVCAIIQGRLQFVVTIDLEHTICLTAKGRMSFTRMVTSSICEAMSLPVDRADRHNSLGYCS